MEKKDTTKEIEDKIQKVKTAASQPKDKKEEQKESPTQTQSTNELDNLKKAIEEKDKQIAELKDTAQRVQAEMENYRKRCERDNVEFKKYVHADLIQRLLPILDSFELALKNTDNTEEFVKGMKLIFSQMYDMLEKEGLRPIKAHGEKFDPYKHEVLLTEKTDADDKDDVINEELQKGYMFKDKVLRYAKVKVYKKS